MAARKKAVKKAKKKKTPARSAQRKTTGKSTAKKRAVKRTSGKTSGKKSSGRSKTEPKRTATLKEPIIIEPGPPPGSVPPVEEPAPMETAVGVVTHYYSHLGVAVVQINTGALRSGDRVRIKGHSTDLTQQIVSMEYEHQHVDQATPGQSVGIKVAEHVREHDIVFVIR